MIRGTRRSWIRIGAFALAAIPPLGCRVEIASPGGRADGTCLGSFCLGMSRAEALRLAGVPAGAMPATASASAASAAAAPAAHAGSATLCLRFAAAGIDLSLRTGPDGPEAAVTGMLVTSIPRCADGAVTGGHAPAAGDLVDCRGVRLGDEAAFVGKMHRQALPIEPAGDLWPEAPPEVRALADTCTPGANDAPRTVLYLEDDRVVGIAIGRR